MHACDKVMGIGAGRKLRRFIAYSSLLRLQTFLRHSLTSYRQVDV